MALSRDPAAEHQQAGRAARGGEVVRSAGPSGASFPAGTSPHPTDNPADNPASGPRRSKTPDGGQHDDERPGIHLGQLRKIRPKELLTRFAFGAGASVLAALVTLAAGYRVGGIFLAFPAILLASLTLIAKESGLQEASETARGGVLGSIALVAFAVSVWQGVHYVSVFIALPAALAVWLLVALGLYGLHRWFQARTA